MRILENNPPQKKLSTTGIFTYFKTCNFHFKHCLNTKYLSKYHKNRKHMVAQLVKTLRHIRKVTGSIPDEVIKFIN
jgi:hypothetical protein